MNEHSLHPPFIYELYTRVIKGTSRDPVFEQIEEQRQVYLQSKEKIAVLELGAGSSISNKKERPIREMARHSLTSPRFSQLLYRLIRHMQAGNILELGTSLGINTLYLSAAAKGKVLTLEGCPHTAEKSRSLFANWPLSNIFLERGPIDDTLPHLLSKTSKLDAVYLDANHTYEASLRYFNILLPHLHEQAFLVVDDIYWSAGMQKAWQEMQRHPKVSLSLDLYDAGILFFNPQLQKAHYILAF